MTQLDSLIRQATDWPNSTVSDNEKEVMRQLTVCNACRYCESFCAVFGAMTRRLTFAQADVHYLANLCHNCGACLHACQYAPPHEFALNVPRAMARVRVNTYAQFAWPSALGQLYHHQSLVFSLALAIGLTLMGSVVMFLSQAADAQNEAKGFYSVMPHGAMVTLFLPVFAWSLLALAVGVTRFLRAIGPATTGAALTPPAGAEALGHALNLTYLDGGHGDGCHNEDDAWTPDRRRAHHLIFYGFLLCFMATSVATFYHYGLGWQAPYDFFSLPKVLGITGGAMMVWGTTWIWRLHQTRHALHREPSQRDLDLGFIALLFLLAVTGLALMILRETQLMPGALVLHLGVVMAFFLTLPYSKMAHGFYRLAALLRHSVEKRQPNVLGLADD